MRPPTHPTQKKRKKGKKKARTWSPKVDNAINCFQGRLSFSGGSSSLSVLVRHDWQRLRSGVWWKEAPGLAVGTQKSPQWDSAEWFLAWFYLQEVKPYLRPDSNPVFSGIEVLLTASVREENHAGNLSYWGWTVKERLEQEEGVMLSCLACCVCTEARNCPLTHISV